MRRRLLAPSKLGCANDRGSEERSRGGWATDRGWRTESSEREARPEGNAPKSSSQVKSRGWPTLCAFCKGRDAFSSSFFSLLLPAVHQQQPFSAFIEPPTTPRPVSRMCNQPLRDGIHVHIVQLLAQLFLGIHIEVAGGAGGPQIERWERFWVPQPFGFAS